MRILLSLALAVAVCVPASSTTFAAEKDIDIVIPRRNVAPKVKKVKPVTRKVRPKPKRQSRRRRGSFTTAGGWRFTGEMQNGKPHGQGRMVHPKGHRYSGEFRNGKRYGWGTMTWPIEPASRNASIPSS